MSNQVQELQNAVKQLSEEQFRFNAKNWDKKIEKDCASAKFDVLINKAISEHKDGKTKQL
ncbi:MAG: hypothetical protein GX221_09840 [Candidatus Riflebacteria bacterium]|nr:hypothetical protein [Candidatus Riflebacteria bacterium]